MKLSTFFAICFGFALALLIWLEKLPIALGYWFITLSIVAFVIYFKDKQAAQNQQWRTKESTLHLIAVLGGWPGAYLAQITLRHKTQKQPFKRLFWLTAFINIAIVLWLASPFGERFLLLIS